MHCYMLESARENENWGRYTFLGFDLKLEITCAHGEMKIGDIKLKTEHPSDYFRKILAEYKSPGFEYLPAFTGGLVGYFPTTIWDTVNRQQNVLWKILKIFRIWI